jgi:hypothetical protein
MVGTDPVTGRWQRALVALVGQDVAHMAVAAGADLQGVTASCLKPRLAVTPGQRQQAQAGTIAVFRVAVLGHQPRYRLGSRRADALAPVDQALWRPCQMRAMGCRHLGSDGGEAALPAVARVTGYPLPAMHELHHCRRHARFQHLPDQRMGHALAMAFDFSVIVDMDLDGLEVRHLVALQCQRLQGWRVKRHEAAGAAARQLLEWLLVEPCQQRRDGRIDLMHAVKLLMAQARHDPAFDDQHRRFRLGLVLQMVWPRRQDRGAVMAREVEHGVIALRLVAVGLRDQGPGIVGDDELRHAAIEAQRPRRRFVTAGSILPTSAV